MKTIALFYAIVILSGGLLGDTRLGTGLIRENLSIVAPKNEIKISTPKLNLPTSVDHSSNMPPVGNQGWQGSCVAWAVGYYYKTYQEWREHNWSVTDLNHQYSPAFIYNQINNGVDNGSSYRKAFILLCQQGCAPLSLMPYDPNDCISWPAENAYDCAINTRCASWHWFMVTNDTGIQQMKQLIADGDNLVIGISIYDNYYSIQAHDTIYCINDIIGFKSGDHANCIVGYDDTKITRDGVGAFRVVNSWGSQWGNRGYYWLSYEAMKDSLLSYQRAFYSTPRNSYVPTFKAKLKLAHENRASAAIKFTISTMSAPLWNTTFYSDYNGGSESFPPNNMVFDLSDGASNLSAAGDNLISLICKDTLWDGITGAIENLQYDYSTWQMSKTPIGVPSVISEVNNTVISTILCRYNDNILRVYPNPCKRDFTIYYNLKNPSKVSLKIYDVIGRCVQKEETASQLTGAHQLTYDIRVPNGVYFNSSCCRGEHYHQETCCHKLMQS